MEKDSKEHFLDMLADCEWNIDYDADTDSNGRQVDCSTFSIQGPLQALITFIEQLGIRCSSAYESWDDAILRAIEGDDKPELFRDCDMCDCKSCVRKSTRTQHFTYTNADDSEVVLKAQVPVWFCDHCNAGYTDDEGEDIRTAEIQRYLASKNTAQ